jgi:hypothetical protein
MQEPPEQPKKRRRNKRRWLTYSDDLLRARVRAVCDHLFAGDIIRFGKHFNVEPKRVRQIFAGEMTVTVRFAAEILTKSSVRAEWLLWGHGDMLDYGTPTDEKPGTLILPDKLQSSFLLFDPLQAQQISKECDVTQFIPLERRKNKSKSQFAIATDNFAGVAAALHKCRMDNQPVLFFIGPDAFTAGAGILVSEMLEKKYVTAVATTGAGLAEDLAVAEQETDLNRVAKLAAKQGIGYGEAVGRWGFDPKEGDLDRSLFHKAHTLNVPAMALVEIGEIPHHLCPEVRGAEVGAAIGAATYADFLLFVATIFEMRMQGGGMIIITGDVHMRASNLLLQAYRAWSAAGIPDITIVTIDTRSNHIPSTECEDSRLRGRIDHVLPGLYRGTVHKLIEHCDAIFSGKTLHDIKQG